MVKALYLPHAGGLSHRTNSTVAPSHYPTPKWEFVELSLLLQWLSQASLVPVNQSVK